jgi:ribonuclease Y
LENYVTRLHDLEALAAGHPGVEKAFAIQAGREMRVMVDPGEVDDEGAALISHEIATAIEREISYPGRIKITVIRESRATNYAR